MVRVSSAVALATCSVFSARRAMGMPRSLQCKSTAAAISFSWNVTLGPAGAGSKVALSSPSLAKVSAAMPPFVASLPVFTQYWAIASLISALVKVMMRVSVGMPELPADAFWRTPTHLAPSRSQKQEGLLLRAALPLSDRVPASDRRNFRSGGADLDRGEAADPRRLRS